MTWQNLQGLDHLFDHLAQHGPTTFDLQALYKSVTTWGPLTTKLCINQHHYTI